MMQKRLPFSIWAPLAAVVFTLLLGAGYLLVPLPPNIDASGGAVLSWMQTHKQALRMQAWLSMVAWLPGGALFALTYARMRGAAAGAFVLGTSLLLALVSCGALLRLGAARHAETLSPQLARVFMDLEAHWGTLATIATVLQSAGLCRSIVEGRFPRWLLPIVSGFALQQLIETVTIVGDGPWLAPGGALNHLGANLYAVWVLSLGMATGMATGLPSRTPSTTPATPAQEPPGFADQPWR